MEYERLITGLFLISIVLFLTIIVIWFIIFGDDKRTKETRAEEDERLLYRMLGLNETKIEYHYFKKIYDFSGADSFRVYKKDQKDLYIFLIYEIIRVRGSQGGYRYRINPYLIFQSSKLKLPLFTLSPETIRDKINSLISQDIDFEQYPKFSSTYLLKGDEDGIRELFDNNQELVEALTTLKKISIIGNEDMILYSSNSKDLKLKNLKRTINDGKRLIDLFISKS